MDEKQSYVEKMQGAMAKLEVKASLAKLEMSDAKKDLIERYDKLHDQLTRLRDDTGEQWYAVQEGFEKGWTAFKTRYDEVMKNFRG